MAGVTALDAKIVLLLCCLAMTQSFAQLDWSGRLSAELTGLDRQAEAYLVPAFALAYQGRQVDLSCAMTSRLDGHRVEQPVDSWQSQNSISWRSPGSSVSGHLAVDHQQFDPAQNPAERQANDDLSGTLRLTMPQTESLSHQLGLTGRYRNRRSGTGLQNQLDERSAYGDYRLNWQRDARTQWGTGLKLMFSEYGVRSLQGSLGWQWQAARLGQALSLTGSRAEQGSHAVNSLGWNAVLSYQRDNWGWRLRGERSQTDAISFFQEAPIDTPVTQQRQLLVDQLTVNVFGLQPIDPVTLTADYSAGQSRVLFNLERLDLDDQTRQHFQQLRAGLTWQPSDAARVMLRWQRRWQEGAASTRVTAEVSRDLNRRWSLGGRWAQDLSGIETPLEWSVAIQYHL